MFVGQFFESRLLLLLGLTTLLVSLGDLALVARVVMDLVLLLEFVLSHRGNVEKVSRILLALVHDILRVQSTNQSQGLAIVGFLAVIVVLEAPDAPAVW